MTETFAENSLPVLWLASKKKRTASGGLISTYELRNGWMARRRVPESRWGRHVYWELYANASGTLFLGGAEDRLTRAIATVFNYAGQQAAVLDAVSRAQRQTSIHSDHP